jgi:tetratricopeptide (TPR) repeat protein
MPEDALQPIVTLLQQAQALENEGKLTPALAHYDDAIARTRSLLPGARTPDIPRALAILLLNRGNALQKLAHEHGQSQRQNEAVESVRQGIAAFDEAIEVFTGLPADDEQRNNVGGTLLNRGHAQLSINDLAGGSASFEQAIAHLEKLPIETEPSHRLNLAGAWTNLANARLSAIEHNPAQALDLLNAARDAARRAVDLLAPFQLNHVAFAELSLRARRALAMATGNLLAHAAATRQPVAELASETSDALDEAMQLARECEKRGAAQLRPLSLLLFRMGAQLYGTHQPQFLGEFLLENVDPANAEAVFSKEPEFCAMAHDALNQVLAHLQRPGMFVAGTPEADKRLAAVQALREAQAQLSPVAPKSNA